VEPSTGETDWWLLSHANTTSFSLVLAALARANGIDEQHPAMLVLDQARWHITQKLEVPAGLHLVFLPSHAPELQPAERLWPLVDEVIVNRYFETLPELEEVVLQRCKQLCFQQELIRGLTQFHWWPDQNFEDSD
jgi:transposase